MAVDGRIPNIAPHLVNEELRLPSSFRVLCAQASYTHEEIGRIVRCLALDTNAFATPRIEPDLEIFDRILKQRENIKLSVRRHRVRKAENALDPDVNPEEYEKNKLRKRGRPSKNMAIKPKVPDEEVSHNNTNEPDKPTEQIVVETTEKPSSTDTATVENTKPDKPDDHIEVEMKSVKPTPVSQQAYVAQVVAAQPEIPKTKAAKMAIKLSDSLFDIMDEPNVPKRSKLSSTDSAVVEATQHTVDTRHDSAWITVKFAIFWKQYPRKVAKADACKAFTKLIKKQADVEGFMRTTLASLEWWKQQSGWTKDNGKYIPYPASWLNGGHWEDSVDNKDLPTVTQAEFLRGDAESDQDLIKRMQGG